ncbi:MAG: hypothetical protein A2504_05445 [Bdellovibrionales bacterium RIFOXYD12_FULL_39_22]|nr:MAG: hypothetical protein A2385_06380 [Bdellovibrionales bacterium RIFOXYB1_FULL_39_21]OFZ41905.1 MAG: hypothetical protein A2485_08350 [Bdellovibrionales bacterium RIFOXYC12_FULL_39_17]OFZ50621.1 MAG: hypothetical protein A2404_05300 [Bdellovibrionales bacterium RIFOXYC1_FULL_39_130]OFZ77844.1 MAG: hypothetical protein A2560_00470 [Bdellovibrionales bacterium RIFOXYD1_FULL_39_84]OFZ93720.1 MAG: hypothetical protein A2504_05445 [Bdellovibrionales bacterium RIFOXYD12_FULL_39_22]HLE11596.1 AT
MLKTLPRSNFCRVAIIYNHDFPSSVIADDEGILSNCDEPPSCLVQKSSFCEGLEARASVQSVAQSVHRALLNIGLIHVDVFPIKKLSAISKIISNRKHDLIFNLCETLDGDSRMEIEVAKLLERGRIPFTGNSAYTLERALSKFHSTTLLRQAHINVPESFLIKSLDELPTINFNQHRFILKPNEQDGSTGIEFSSVVNDQKELATQAKLLFENGQGPLIAQQYIDGREINLAIIGNKVNKFWNCSEIDFSKLPENLPKILNYSSKWIEESPEYKKTVGIRPELSSSLRNKIFEIGIKTAKALKISSYARLDLRIDSDENPYVIDINPNCDLDPTAGLARSASYNGLGHEALIFKIMEIAFENFTSPKNFLAPVFSLNPLPYLSAYRLKLQEQKNNL